MARTKRIEKAAPKQAEIVSFAALKARRDAGRADVFFTVGIIEGEVAPGEVCVLVMRDGTHALGYVDFGDEDQASWHVLNKCSADAVGVCGRVVLCDITEV